MEDETEKTNDDEEERNGCLTRPTRRTKFCSQRPQEWTFVNDDGGGRGGRESRTGGRGDRGITSVHNLI